MQPSPFQPKSRPPHLPHLPQPSQSSQRRLLRSTTAAVITGLALFETALIAALKVALSFMALCFALALIGAASLLGVQP